MTKTNEDTIERDEVGNIYNLTDPPKWMAHEVAPKPGDAPHWSGRSDDGLNCLPSIGARVIARGDMGVGVVAGYFVEFGYVGVELKLEKPPAWWLKQNTRGTKARLFGAELRGYSR